MSTIPFHVTPFGDAWCRRVFVGQGAGSKGKGAKSGGGVAAPGACEPGMKQKEQKQVGVRSKSDGVLVQS